MIPLADLGQFVTGLGTLATVVAVITGVFLNVRKRPSDEQIAEATARAAEDAFYKGRLERSEADLATESAARRAADERVEMLEDDVAKLRRAKDDAVHLYRIQASDEREVSRALSEHVDRLRAQLRGLGVEPTD